MVCKKRKYLRGKKKGERKGTGRGEVDMVLIGGGKARPRAIYVVAGLIPLCLFAALVVDRSGHPSALLATNPALLAAADLERAG
jgi:hypothetical protein